MSKKLTYEYVKSKFEEEGYELLSTKYVNNHSKLLCKCYRGHEIITKNHLKWLEKALKWRKSLTNTRETVITLLKGVIHIYRIVWGLLKQLIE